MNKKAKTKSDGNRDQKGRFVKGCAGGPGRGHSSDTIYLEEFVNMEPIEVLDTVARRAVASKDVKAQLAGANLLLKLQGMKGPEEDVVMSPLVREIVLVLGTMAQRAEVRASELLGRMKEVCFDCPKVGCDSLYRIADEPA